MTAITLTIEDHILFADDDPIQELPRLASAATVSVWTVPTDYVDSGYFIDIHTANEAPSVPACASSDAHLVATLELDADEAAMAAAARAERLEQANEQADLLLAQLDADYPDREVLTWDQQVKEAEALQADPEASVPLLQSLAAFRDIDLQELATKVLDKSLMYKVASGQIMGARQWVEKALEAADSHDDVLAVSGVAERFAVARAEA